MNAEEIIKKELKTGAFSHAYFLVGSEKKTGELAELFINLLEIDPRDISRITPAEEAGKAGEIKVDSVRELLHRISLTAHGKHRLAIIEQCQRLNQSSGNILLKNLEESSGSVIFILTAQNHSVLPTVKSRCRVVEAGFDEGKEPELCWIPEIVKGGFSTVSRILEEVVKKGETEDFFLEMTNFFAVKLRLEKNMEGVSCLEEIERARRDISFNVNPRLVLENLYLILEGNLK